MKLKPYSFDGTQINDGTIYSAFFPLGSVLSQAEGNAILSQRVSNVPAFARKAKSARTLPVVVIPKGTINTQVDDLKVVFDTFEDSLKTFMAQDENTNEYWTLQATTITQNYDAGEFTAVLSVPDPIWKSSVQSSDSWSVSASGSTHGVDSTGNVFVRPVITIKPTSAKTTSNGFAYKRFITIENNKINTPFSSYPIDVTGGGLDTAALVGAGKIASSDGYDFRFFIDGTEQPRWLNDMDSTSTKMWANIDLPSQRTVTLSGAIASSDSITAISVKNTETNKTSLTMIKNQKPKGIIKIGNELFTYTGILTDVLDAMGFTGVTRAERGTSAATHADGATITMIPLDAWIAYGDTSLGDPAYSTATAPMFTTSDSSNTSWVYADFNTNANTRSGSWSGRVISRNGPNSEIYTATAGTFATPNAVMGMTIEAFQSLGTWRADSANIEWRIYQPAGVSECASTGEVYASSTALWLDKANLEYSTDGTAWAVQWTQTAPASSTTWTAFDASTSGAFGASYPYVRYRIQGACAANQYGQSSMGIAAATLTLDSTGVPSVTVGAETGGYHLKCTISNATNGDSLSLDYIMELNQSLEIDCENHTITYLKDNQSAISALKYPGKFEWFTLSPGSNDLTFTDVGTQAVTVTFNWYNRRS